MSYGEKYYIRFKNRQAHDIYRVEILEKDFSGDAMELTGADPSPFVAACTEADNDIFSPIKASEFTVSFLTDKNNKHVVYDGTADADFAADENSITLSDQDSDNGVIPGMLLVISNITYHIESVEYSDALDELTLYVAETLTDHTITDADFVFYEQINIEAFYSDDDERYRLDFYFESKEDGTGTEKLLHTGYLAQDGSSEDVTDRRHVISLKATDNLGLLKQTTLDKTAITNIDGQKIVIDIIQACIDMTGIDIPLNIYANVFENTTDDKGDSTTADPFSQTIMTPLIFNSDNAWQDCYTILSDILSAFNACIFQALGQWHIMRVAEYKLFSGAIPGVNFDTSTTAFTLDDAAIIDLGNTVHPVNEDQVKMIQRPYKHVKNTFNYNLPNNLIKNLDLKTLGTYRSEFTDGDNTVKEYDLPDWFLTPTLGSGTYDYWIRVVFDANNVEIDRYIVVDHSSDSVTAEILSSGVYLNANDRIDISFQFRTEDSQTGPGNVIWIISIDDGTNLYKVNQNNGTTIDGSWSTTGGIVYGYSSDVNLNEWQSITIRSLNIPVDGWLNIWLSQAKNGGGKTFVKDLNASFSAFINDTTEITGQYHLNEQNLNIKNISENDISIDDSPRNFIPGTLLTDDLTTFSAPLPPNPATYYITKTKTWHRSDNSEDLRLGEIITLERLQLAYTSRLIIQGSFAGVRYDEWQFINMLTLLQFGWVTNKNFLPTSMTIDYMQNHFSLKALEVYKDYEDDFASTYNFSYIYKTDKN